MRYFLLPLFFTIFLKADTDSVDTSSFDFAWIAPMEFSYISTKDDGTLYHIGVGVGASLEYNLFEVQTSLMFIPGTKSNTLFSWNDESFSIGDTIKYGGTLLYKLNNNWQIGIDYSKYEFLTNKGEISNGGTTYGKASSSNLMVLYDPLGDINIEKERALLIVGSLGYFNAPDVTYEEKIKYYYGGETQHIKKKYDLSGSIFTLGLMKKF